MPRLKTDSADPYERRFTFPKWNTYVSVLEEHRLMKYLPEFSTWSKAKHRSLAEDYRSQAIAMHGVYQDTVARYIKAYGDGVLISGGFREHWPEDVRNAVRSQSRRINRFTDIAIAHWKASGARSRIVFS